MWEKNGIILDFNLLPQVWDNNLCVKGSAAGDFGITKKIMLV